MNRSDIKIIITNLLFCMKEVIKQTFKFLLSDDFKDLIRKMTMNSKDLYHMINRKTNGMFLPFLLTFIVIAFLVIMSWLTG